MLNRHHSFALQRTGLDDFRKTMQKFTQNYKPELSNDPKCLFPEYSLTIDEEVNGFAVIYQEKSQGDPLLRIVVARYIIDEVDVRMAWDLNAAEGFARAFIFFISSRHKDRSPVPPWLNAPEYQEIEIDYQGTNEEFLEIIESYRTKKRKRAVFQQDGYTYTLSMEPDVTRIAHRVPLIKFFVNERLRAARQHRDRQIEGITFELKSPVDGVSHIKCRYLKLFEAEFQEMMSELGGSLFNKKSTGHQHATRKSGARGLKAHRDAIVRLRKDQPKEANYYQWMREYEDETGTHPDETRSGGTELYRKSVWNHFRKESGNN